NRQKRRKANWLLSPTIAAAKSQASEESVYKRRDLIGRFVEREVTCFQNMDFRTRHIFGVGGPSGNGEGSIVLSPQHQQLRSRLAKPLLPSEIRGDVRPVIEKQLGLDVSLARTTEER